MAHGDKDGGMERPPLVTLEPVGPGNWRACAGLTVTPSQQRFVATVAYYLALCAYDDGTWNALAVRAAEDVVGFVMWAIDTDDSFWIGGLVIDARHQKKGYGASVVDQMVSRAKEEGRSVALSYELDNTVARSLYGKLGFVETGETVDDEVVARRGV